MRVCRQLRVVLRRLRTLSTLTLVRRLNYISLLDLVTSDDLDLIDIMGVVVVGVLNFVGLVLGCRRGSGSISFGDLGAVLWGRPWDVHFWVLVATLLLCQQLNFGDHLLPLWWYLLSPVTLRKVLGPCLLSNFVDLSYFLASPTWLLLHICCHLFTTQSIHKVS